ncbi:MAG: YjiH family protein [Enterococcus sp.]
MSTTKTSTMKFIFFSLLGFILFLVPFSVNGESKIFISHFVDFIYTLYDPFLIFTEIMASIVILGSILFQFYSAKSAFLNELFKASPLNFFTRVTGSLLYLSVINQWFEGTAFGNLILDPNTGGTMAGDGGLLTTLYITFFIGVLILPLITHFGAVEYIGTLCAPVVERVFKVPGYSAVDAIASFVGDGTIGLVVTDQQYQRGYYSKREAYVIATSFSIVGIAFASAVAEELGFGQIFSIFYASIAIAVILIALVNARMHHPKFPNTYYNNQEPKKHLKPTHLSTHQHAVDLAVKQADSVSFKEVFLSTAKSILNIYIGFIPVIMLVGTVALILAEKTAIFNIIALPFVPLYHLLGFSNEVAKEMAPATIVGFADMYLPALFIKSSASEAARFFIGVLSFTQLIFMSETGMVLLKTKIGLNFWDVIKVFVFRTILSIPIVLGITYVVSLTGLISW